MLSSQLQHRPFPPVKPFLQHSPCLRLNVALSCDPPVCCNAEKGQTKRKNRENICRNDQWTEIGVSFLCYRRANSSAKGKTIFFSDKITECVFYCCCVYFCWVLILLCMFLWIVGDI